MCDIMLKCNRYYCTGPMKPIIILLNSNIRNQLYLGMFILHKNIRGIFLPYPPTFHFVPNPDNYYKNKFYPHFFIINTVLRYVLCTHIRTVRVESNRECSFFLAFLEVVCFTYKYVCVTSTRGGSDTPFAVVVVEGFYM